MKKTLIQNLVVLTVAGSLVTPAFAWVPIIDDIKKVVEVVEREVRNGTRVIVKGGAALGCGAVAIGATGNAVAGTVAAGACADAVK